MNIAFTKSHIYCHICVQARRLRVEGIPEKHVEKITSILGETLQTNLEFEKHKVSVIFLVVYIKLYIYIIYSTFKLFIAFKYSYKLQSITRGLGSNDVARFKGKACRTKF